MDNYRDKYESLLHVIQSIRSNKVDFAITEEHIPLAQHELDEVVSSMERGMNTILTCVEDIQKLNIHDARLDPLITQIYEAATFHDLSGQRVSKVLKTFRHIADFMVRLDQEIHSPSNDAHGPTTPSKSKLHQKSYEESLMNGPQSTANAPSQDQIDDLFNKK